MTDTDKAAAFHALDNLSKAFKKSPYEAIDIYTEELDRTVAKAHSVGMGLGFLMGLLIGAVLSTLLHVIL